jgi:hypothetical protein
MDQVNHKGTVYWVTCSLYLAVVALVASAETTVSLRLRSKWRHQQNEVNLAYNWSNKKIPAGFFVAFIDDRPFRTKQPDFSRVMHSRAAGSERNASQRRDC